MTIVGQPKTTAQYIQVSGRVGRNAEVSPGLVLTIYGAAKPRDRSHYERFRTYHQQLYAQVEPTSVTPFATPVLRRALHAAAVADVRQIAPDSIRTRSRRTSTTRRSRCCANGPRSLIAGEVPVLDQMAADARSPVGEVGAHRVGSQRHRRRPEAGAHALRRRRCPTSTAKATIWDVPTSMRNVDAECQLEDHARLQPGGRRSRGGSGMSTGNMRRAQLVTPFGVGAMSVLVNGTSVITAGLDHWYEVDDISTLALEEYRDTTGGWKLGCGSRSSACRRTTATRARAGSAQRPADSARPALPALVLLHVLQAAQAQHADHAAAGGLPGQGARRPAVQAAHVPGAVRRYLHRTGTWTTSRSTSGCIASTTRDAPASLRLTSRGGGGLEGQVVAATAAARSARCGVSPTSRRDSQRRRAHHADRPAVLARRPVLLRTALVPGWHELEWLLRTSRSAAPCGRGQRLLPEGRVLDLPAAPGGRCQRRAPRPDATPERRPRHEGAAHGLRRQRRLSQQIRAGTCRRSCSRRSPTRS